MARSSILQLCGRGGKPPRNPCRCCIGEGQAAPPTRKASRPKIPYIRRGEALLSPLLWIRRASPTFGRLERNDVRLVTPGPTSRTMPHPHGPGWQDGSRIREPEGERAAEPAVRIDGQSEKQAPPHQPIARAVRLTNACRFDILQPGRSAEDHAIKNSASLSRLSAARRCVAAHCARQLGWRARRRLQCSQPSC